MRKILFILGMAGYGLATYSQVDFGKYGQLSGSLESNSVIYVKDNGLPKFAILICISGVTIT